ncbi:MAG: leucine dehydrogenase [Flavobacteriales bacterium]|nr:leucine dehydrogenase [Flavobacteriales bacterium]|tara:strand:+ start:22478 stop:23563 length:1086 start_codon:yes stop_codon:yes gene_type:complete
MKITNIRELKNINHEVLKYMSDKRHEKVVHCYDKETNLEAIIAVHNTNLGPALGGTRMWQYKNTSDAIKDVLRLSRGMTYKASITGLNLGGGKAVIIGNSEKKTDEMMHAFGKFVETLKGLYITAEDVGMTTYDMSIIHKETNHVVGKPTDLGGSGDPSVVTAYGVLMGMKGSAFYKWGSDKLNGKKILIQGVGNVGKNLIQLLQKENADIYINDLNLEKALNISTKYNLKIIKDNIYSSDIDIYAPCALGGTLNEITIPQLKCDIVAGAANNQLAKENIHDELLSKYNILYAPDFLINAGGLINVYSELKGVSRDEVTTKTENIFHTTIEILKKSNQENISSQKAALKIAKERVFKKHNA